MRITENMMANNSIYNLQQIQTNINQLTLSTTSQQNINQPSDNPAATNTLLNINDSLNAITQYQTNITNATTSLNVANNALTGITSSIEQAQTLVASITNGTIDASTQQSDVEQLEELKQQIVNYGNTQSGNTYVFGGTDTSTPPFSTTTNTTPTGAYLAALTTAANAIQTQAAIGVGPNSAAALATAVAALPGVTAADTTAATAISTAATAAMTAATTAVTTPNAANLAAAQTAFNALNTLTNGTTFTTAGAPALLATFETSLNASNTAVNTAVNTVTNAYYGNDNPSNIEVTKNTYQNVNISGDSLLTGTGPNTNYGTTNILQTFDNLIATVQNTPTNPTTAQQAANATAIQNGATALAAGLAQVQNATADVAARLGRLTAMTTMNTNNQTTLQNTVSNIQHVDLNMVGTELSQEQTAYQAALSATAQISKLSLLNYLS